MTSCPPARPLPIVVLISGGGTTLRNLIEKQRARQLAVDFRLVISSNPHAAGLGFARDAGIPTRIVPWSRTATADDRSRDVFDACRQVGAALVVMGGFLKHVPIPPDFQNRVMNIHPALIPAFCGQGFYGERVHQAVLAYGAKVSGCTVHFADNQYDHGPIILQRAVEVRQDDTPDSLAHRVFEAECRAYPDAIQLFADGRLRVSGRICQILPPAS